MSRARVSLFVLLVAASCKTQHEHRPHSESTKAASEIPTLSATVYQSALEVFVEYPALVVGRPSPLVAHFTDVRDPDAFRPVTKGRVTAILGYGPGQEDRFVASEPLRDGIFKPVVTPTKPGRAALLLLLEGEQMSGSVDIGGVEVDPTINAPIAAAREQQSDGLEAKAPVVSFLKEQQWKTRYGTALAEVRALEGAVRANGEIKAVAGKSAELSSPVAGRIPVAGQVPHIGQRVKKGQLLATVSPTTTVAATSLASVELDVSRAQAELRLAERELKRAQDLFTAKAIPEKQVDAARTTHEVATARLEAADRQLALYRSAQAGAAGGGGRAVFELRSPMDGVIFHADVTPGAVVEAGARLLAVVNSERVWLEAKVYETDVPRVERSSGASFTVAGFDREFVVDESNGKRIAVGAVVDRATRTVPVIYELDNRDGALKPGMFAKMNLFTGETVRGVAVPQSALVDDNGRAVVFVLKTGETFEKRVVRPGVRSGGFVQIADGVKVGERVVSQGAYEIKLSAATGAMPDHGHQH